MNKRTIIIILTFIGISIAAWAFNPIGINIGPAGVFRVEVAPQHSPHTTIHNLQDRVWHLERAVAQLQTTVYHLENKPKLPTKEYSCFLDTNFYGTFTANGTSQNAAKGKVLKDCKAKGGGIFCKEKEVKCD